MIDGIYSITFRGAADWGIGLLHLQGGLITGADAGGIKYDGSYTISGESVAFHLQMKVPPGATLVQGTPARSMEYTVPVHAVIPRRAFKTGEPVRVELPPGPVNVIFLLLRSFGS